MKRPYPSSPVYTIAKFNMNSQVEVQKRYPWWSDQGKAELQATILNDRHRTAGIEFLVEVVHHGNIKRWNEVVGPPQEELPKHLPCLC
jgi:hypothetical protein